MTRLANVGDMLALHAGLFPDKIGAADLDRADRCLDQDARKPRHPACAIDNHDAEIKIQLDIKRLTRPGVLARCRAAPYDAERL